MPAVNAKRPSCSRERVAPHRRLIDAPRPPIPPRLCVTLSTSPARAGIARRSRPTARGSDRFRHVGARPLDHFANDRPTDAPLTKHPPSIDGTRRTREGIASLVNELHFTIDVSDHERSVMRREMVGLTEVKILSIVFVPPCCRNTDVMYIEVRDRSAAGHATLPMIASQHLSAVPQVGLPALRVPRRCCRGRRRTRNHTAHDRPRAVTSQSLRPRRPANRVCIRCRPSPRPDRARQGVDRERCHAWEAAEGLASGSPRRAARQRSRRSRRQSSRSSIVASRPSSAVAPSARRCVTPLLATIHQTRPSIPLRRLH